MRRAKPRFGLLVGAVGLLVFLILFQQTLLSTLLGFFSGALEHQSAAVVVYSDEARKNLEGSVVSDEQVAATAQVAGVGRAEPLGQSTFTLRTREETLDAALFGYVLGGPGSPTRLVEGRLPRAPAEGVASDIDADRGLDIGDTVRVVGPGATLPIRIVGLASGSRFSVDPVVFVSYETYAEAVRTKNPDAQAVTPSIVAVAPEPGVDPTRLAQRITREVAGVEALDRQEAADSLPGVAGVSSSFAIVLTLVFVVVTLVVGIFFVILTVQKTNALTLLRAIGADRWYLTRALLVQVLAVVVGGIAVGALLLWVATLASSGGLVIGLALLASFAATRRVLRLDPVAATGQSGALR
jgi:putative ABC transport system permease protein